MKKILKYLPLVGLLMSIQAWGQYDFSNQREKWVKVQDTVLIDSLSIFPSSIKIEGLDTSQYKVLPFKGKVVFNKPYPDSVKVKYEVLPFNLTTPFSLRNEGDTVKERVSRFISRNPYNYTRKELTREDLFGGESLRKGGSISRGVRVGNNQDLSLNSNMNLQLSGSFQGVEIMAAITDNNIPIQPQGNTQTLQEFDKVYIQFAKNGHQLTAGDFQTEQKKDLFLRFNKKAQGLSYQGKYKTKLFGRPANYDVRVDAALSRGKFSRNQILGIEGNQGPYQLRGAENEQFIIILSGTEKVYIDGKLLKRGMDNDYTIDYNTAEITFTTNQLITKDKRIIVEFQYSDQNYGRSLFHAGNEIKNEKGRFFVNLYSEQDMKFQQLQQSLSDDNLNLLAQVGDSLHLAVTPKIDSVEFNSNLVLYMKKDTVVDFVSYTFYKQSNDPDSAFYQLGFSNVGQGNGNYIIGTSNANGRVYEWVAPVGGQKQGEYEPLVQLIAPKQQQMATIGAEYNITKNTNVFIEGAFSNANQNLFSDIHKANDQGIAINTRIGNTKPFSGKSKTYQVVTKASYQLVNKNFSRIERFRSVEFERDYNLSSSSTTDEHIGTFSSVLKENGKSLLGVNVSYVDRGSAYNGLKSGGDLNIPLWKGAKIQGYGNYLTANGTTQNSDFYRHKFTLQQSIKAITLKAWEEQENNQVINNGPDTLANTSFDYRVFGASVGVANKDKMTFDIGWDQRTDYLPFNNDLNQTTLANNVNAKFTFKGKKSSRFLWNSTFRELQITNDKLTAQDPENTLLNRLEYKFKLWKGMVSSSSFFEVATGSELKRQYAYVEVNPGQGVYTWIDHDNDSVQDLTEFMEAQFSDQANYVRVFIPTNEFIKTYSNQFNQSLNIVPAKFFKRNTKAKKFLTRWNDQFILKLNQKLSKDNGQQFQVPFQNALTDTNLISVTSAIRNTVYFNRSNPKFGANYSYSKNQNKSLLTVGFEGREIESNSVDLRWNFLRMFTLRSKIEISDKSRSVEIDSSRDYSINIRGGEPKLSYQKGSSFRLTLKGAWKEKQNSIQHGGEFASFKKVGGEVTYNLLTKGRMSASVDYIETTFSGEEGNSSPLLFDMLEGFQIGTNFTWNARYQRTFKNNFQLSLMYEGRSSETSKVIHTGNAQVQLMF